MANMLLKKLFQPDKIGLILERFLASDSMIYGVLIEDTPISIGTLRKDSLLVKEISIAEGIGAKISVSADSSCIKEKADFLCEFLKVLANLEYERKKILYDSLERYREIAIISRLSKNLAGALTIKEIGNVILTEIFSRLNIEYCSFMLIEGDELIVRAANQGTGEVTISENAIRLKRGEGIAGSVIKYGEYEIVNNPSSDPRFVPSKREIKNLLCVPLKVGDKVLGVLNMSNTKDGRDFSSENANFSMILANSAAVAIENANLHKENIKKERYKIHLERYLSKDIVDELVKTDEWLTLTGRKQKVTILFCDMRNFTSISENISPDNLVRLLNDFFSEITTSVFEHKGTVDKFIGDMMMATFGVPNPGADDAKMAVSAACDMQLRTQVLSRKWAPLTISISIGINTGEVIFGNIGCEQHMDFTVIGDPVNVAYRLESIALPGQILVTDNIYDELKNDFLFRDFKEITVKGKAKPLLVKEVVY